jgi:hypothetical protein
VRPAVIRPICTICQNGNFTQQDGCDDTAAYHLIPLTPLHTLHTTSHHFVARVISLHTTSCQSEYQYDARPSLEVAQVERKWWKPLLPLNREQRVLEAGA